uniref:Arrestin C-terminal-like domain-containing protein n=1 Tax=Setaria digitata TaxID=48799 RepID=A0A915PV21_9BILA
MQCSEEHLHLSAGSGHTMPIEIVAKLERESAVYLAGEAIQCKVTVQNIGNNEESLAWGSVHVQCERIVRANKPAALQIRKNSVEEKSKQNGTTSISRSAFTVFSCRPVILFCELVLNAGESRNFECTQQLPLDSIPPSFKGHLVRYVYKLTLGVQHVKSPIKLIHVPLRIIQSELGLTLPSSSMLANPFINNNNVGPSIIDLAMEAADCLTAPHGSYSYNMTNESGLIASFLLNKKAYKLGEDVIGRFSFDSSTVRCYIRSSEWLQMKKMFYWQPFCYHADVGNSRLDLKIVYFELVVSLQSVENLINEEWCPHTFVTTHMTEHIVCAYWTEAAVRLHIPLSATPTFYTDTVHLKWRLHFEFVTCNDFKEEVEEGLWQAPANVNIETMAWDLDIKVFPCSPHNAALTLPGLTPPASIVV